MRERNFNPRFPRGKRHLIEARETARQNFNPRFPRGKRPVLRILAQADIRFQSTLPAGEATYWGAKVVDDGRKFQSTLPAGEATGLTQTSIHWSKFQSTLPAGEATSVQAEVMYQISISIHASRGGSDLPKKLPISKSIISIHASRGGSDGGPKRRTKMRQNFNPRFPRGKRPAGTGRRCYRILFQSTLPAGEATIGRSAICALLADFNPRFPRGKRQGSQKYYSMHHLFQSTLPAGEATWPPLEDEGKGQFQSTLPAGEATSRPLQGPLLTGISIHASRGGSDLKGAVDNQTLIDFNPRFPRGKRPDVFPQG